MAIGANIKRFRKLRGLTQERLAEKAKISRSYLADVERNRYNPSVDTLQAIAKVLDVRIDDLLQNPEHKTNSGLTEQGPTIDTPYYTKEDDLPPLVKELWDKLSSYPPDKQERIIKQLNDLFEILLKEENRS